MFVAKNNSSASTLSSSITNKNTDTFIQPKLDNGKSRDNQEVETDKTADQATAKTEKSSSSFFQASPASQKQSEEEVQTQENQDQETQQTVTPEVETSDPSSKNTTSKNTRENNTSLKEEGEGKQDQQKSEGNESVSDTKDTSSKPAGEGQANTTTADATATQTTASQSASNSVEKTEESKEEEKEDVEQEKVKEAAIPKAPTRPEDDPAFKTQIKKTEDAKTEKSQHPDPTNKVGEQKAAGHASPASQTKKGNQEAHAESLNAVSEKKREPFTPKGFKDMLKSNLNDLENKLPKNSDEAKEFRDDKPIDGIKENISGQVTGESDKLAGPMKQEAKKPAPDVGSPVVEATPLPPADPGTTPKPLDAKASVPKPKTSQEISMEKESQSLDSYMADNEIKDEQLAKSNEPKFTGALEEKNTAQKEAKLAPIKYRKKEKAQLSKAQKTATADSTQGLDQMQAAKVLSEGNVLQNQTTNKDSDKTEKEKIYGEFEKIYNDTKKTVTDSLEKLSDDVDKKFSSEAESAQKSFEKNVEDGLGDIYGWTVVDDWLFGEDTEAIERLFRKEKSKFISKMDTVLDDISVIISDGLNAALDAIAEGKRLSKEKFDSLDESQKKLAEDAFTDFNDQYSDLEDTVYEKQEELAKGLAKSYKENVDSLRGKFDEIKEKVSAGWIGGALKALEAVVKAIMKIKDLLLGLLSAVVSAIGAIISDPIGFLSNLISGVKQGFENFGKNIKKNIIQGLIEWLTGSLGNVGIQIPDNLFSLSGIFSLVTQMLGLTWDYFRSLAVKMLGETVVAGMEKAVEIFTIVKDKGVEGLWDYIKEQFSNLKEMVMDAIRDMVITKVIEAGIKWVLGLMSPAGAFVKAAMMIIDIVKFFVERAAQIFELVQAFMDSIKALAAGNVSAVAKGIEKALTKAIPVLIGFLASLVGITGLTGKVQKIIKKVRKKIDKAMKKIILKAKKLFKRKGGKKVTKKDVKDKKNTKEHDKKVEKGLKYLDKISKVKDADKNKKITKEDAKEIAADTKKKHPIFKSITPKKKGKKWIYDWRASKGTHVTTYEVDETDPIQVRVQEAHSKAVFQSNFDTQDWKKSFGISVRVARDDIQWGRKNGRIFPNMSVNLVGQKGKLYSLKTLSPAQIVVLAVKEVSSKGHNHSALKDDITWTDIRDFNASAKASKIPNDPTIYTQDICNQIMGKLKEDGVFEQDTRNPSIYRFTALPPHPDNDVEVVGGQYKLKAAIIKKHEDRSRALRKRYYGTSYNSDIQERLRQMLSTPKGKPTKKGNIGLMNPKNPNKYWYKNKYWDKNVKNQEPTMEHDPKVSAHWNSDGVKGVKQDRKGFYNFAGKENDLIVMPAKVNKGEGNKDKAKYTYFVKITFKST
ncbi:hypothetical protein [Dokdonia sp.]|uniref:phage tail protein n=1 Tax=Dokdonia sp. TaxID=2024995 RepID=UPI003264AC53